MPRKRKVIGSRKAGPFSAKTGVASRRKQKRLPENVVKKATGGRRKTTKY